MRSCSGIRQGASLRRIAEELGISRGAVRPRAGAGRRPSATGRPRRAPSRAGAAASSIAYEPILKELLARIRT